MFTALVQVFKPGGITGTAGTPNFLRDISDLVERSEWTDIMVGGLQDATFEMQLQYEDTTDLLGGNWLIFGCRGGSLHAAYAAGAGAIVVDYATDDPVQQGVPGVQEFAAGDAILISDGIHTDLMLVSAVSYSGSQATITLGSAVGQGTATLLNGYGIGSVVCRLQFQGIITSRTRTTEWTNKYALRALGMGWRYNNTLASFDVHAQDSATSLLNIATQFGSKITEVIVNSANFAGANGIMYTGTSNGAQPLMQVITDILRTESGGATAQTPNEASYWAFWVDALRQAHHQKVKTDIPSPATPTYTIDLIGGSVNLAPDSDTLSGWTIVSGGAFGTGGPGGATDYEITGTGSAAGYIYLQSSTLTVTPGASYTFSSWCDPSQITSAGAIIAIYDPTLNTQYTAIGVGPNTSRITAQRYACPAWTCPAGVTQIRLLWDTANCTIANGQKLKFSQPMLTITGQQDPSQYTPWHPTNAYGDVCGPVTPTDMDMSQLLNTVLVMGGKDGSGKQVEIIVTNSSSITQYGHYEGTLSNPNITDKDALALWASGVLGVRGWPRQTSRLALTVDSCRMTARDQLGITGFTDGSELVTNPVEIRRQADAKQRIVTSMITLSQMQPDISSLMSQIANQRSLRHLEKVPDVRLGDAYVVYGCEVTYTGGTLNYAVSAGQVSYGGTLYTIPAYTGTAPSSGHVRIGAQVSGTPPTGVTLPSIVPLPSYTGISTIYAQNVYDFGATGLVAQTNFQGIEIAKISALNGAITATTDERALGGVDGFNIVPIPSGTTGSPTLGAMTLAPEGLAAVAATVPVTLPSSWVSTNWLDHIAVLVSVAGANSWSVTSSIRNIVNASQTVVVHGLAGGQSYDIALQPVPYNGNPGSAYALGVSPTIASTAITTALQNVIDDTGNLLASAFPGQMAMQSSGSYAGWGLMTVAKLKDSQPLVAKQNVTIWAKWVVLYPSTSVFGYGPAFYDAAGNKIQVSTYSGGGALWNNSTNLTPNYANALNDGKPHTFLAGITYLGSYAGTNYWHVLAYADGHCICSWSGAAALNPAAIYPGFGADAASQVYIKEFALNSPPVMPQTKNLAVNGTLALPSLGSDNVNPPSAKQLIPGWVAWYQEGGDSLTLPPGSNDGGGAFDAEKPNSLSAMMMRPASTTSQWSQVVQRISVSPGQWIALRCWVYWQNVQAGHVKLIWYKSDGTSATGTGTLSASATTYFNWFPNYTANTASGWQLVEHVMQVPSDAAWVDFAQMDGWSGDGVNAAYSYLAAVSIVAGQIPVPANESTINLGNGVGGKINGSTFIMDQGSIPPSTSPGVSLSASNSSGVCAVTISWSAGTINLPDGSTISIGANSWTDTGLIAAVTYHYSLYVDINGTMHVLGNYGQNISPTSQQKYQVYLDGRYPITEDAYITTPATSGGGGTGGGGGGGTSCPSLNQIVRVKELGYVPASEYRVGMHLLGPDGQWKKILRVEYEVAQLFMLTVAGETYEIDTNHYWKGADGDFVKTPNLSLNTLLRATDGRILEIDKIEKGEIGMIAKTQVEGGQFVIGQLIGHNVLTQ